MSFILDFLFPKKCVGCKKPDTYFCKSCTSNILQKELVCPICERSAMGGQTHPICKSRFGLDGLWNLGIYKNPLRSAIQTLKYRRVRGLAEVLADIILEYWIKYQPFILDKIKRDKRKGWMIIPVPLYFWRENSRGFNQSSLVGQILSKSLGLDYCDALKRIRYTKSQVKLKSKDRQKNIKNAFAVSKPYTLDPKPYILLIDDVWTTGSTLKECCCVLKRAGAKSVWAITLAR
ncbi:ComF family protein [Patescibacteria group bacterium]|nr:ComF family protein [Patescibacteria group bacterium]